MQLTPNPTADPAIAERQPVAGSRGSSASSCCVFASTGIGNGSTYKMIPAIWRSEAETHDRGRDAGARPPRSRRRPSRPAAALGVIGAVGAMGGFLIPIAFSSPWVDNPMSATKGAFVVFTAFYVVCAAGDLRRLPAQAGRGRHEPRRWPGSE